ncbi:hypothetical protein [Aliikangiella sp. IMCC44359]|uniref:hypothetical protein n=1 Tax=Aliikangiella sp. IMCC44359 TaxID=3459125 RepID=UPI00403B267B
MSFEKWYINEVDADDEFFGAGVCSCGKKGYHLDCQNRIFQAKKEWDFISSLVNELGYSKVVIENNSAFGSTEKIIFDKLDINGDFEGYERSDVLESTSTFFFPVGWIGCCGHLVIKDSFEVVSFGSYIGEKEHIWAYHQSISLETLGKDRKNTFTILKVQDVENTTKVLKSFLDSRYVNNEIVPKFNRQPITLEDVDLYFGIRNLLTSKYKGWFEFEIS